MEGAGADLTDAHSVGEENTGTGTRATQISNYDLLGSWWQIWIRIILESWIRIFIRKKKLDLDPYPHQSQFRSCRGPKWAIDGHIHAHNRDTYKPKWSRGGSVDQWSQIRIT
jgi:hypothetical protein